MPVQNRARADFKDGAQSRSPELRVNPRIEAEVLSQQHASSRQPQRVLRQSLLQCLLRRLDERSADNATLLVALRRLVSVAGGEVVSNGKQRRREVGIVCQCASLCQPFPTSDEITLSMGGAPFDGLTDQIVSEPQGIFACLEPTRDRLTTQQCLVGHLQCAAVAGKQSGSDQLGGQPGKRHAFAAGNVVLPSNEPLGGGWISLVVPCRQTRNDQAAEIACPSGRFRRLERSVKSAIDRATDAAHVL